MQLVIGAENQGRAQELSGEGIIGRPACLQSVRDIGVASLTAGGNQSQQPENAGTCLRHRCRAQITGCHILGGGYRQHCLKQLGRGEIGQMLPHRQTARRDFPVCCSEKGRDICLQVAEGLRQVEINVNPRMILESIIFAARNS